MKMIGILHSSSFNLACNCRPDIFGIRMSTIRHAARVCKSDSRNSSADPKHRATSPAASIRSRSESCMASSSSMIAINLDVRSTGMRDSLRDLMEAAGLVARCFGSAEEFLESGLHRQAACLITDILMPKMSGLELQTRLKEEECDIPIIFITAYGDASMRIQAMREGAVEFLAKPFDHQLMLKTVRAALDL